MTSVYWNMHIRFLWVNGRSEIHYGISNDMVWGHETMVAL